LFIKRIEVNRKQVTLHYNLPIPQDGKSDEQIGVLPIDTLSGDRVSTGRTSRLGFGLIN
jgi:hypothetical protein